MIHKELHRDDNIIYDYIYTQNMRLSPRFYEYILTQPLCTYAYMVVITQARDVDVDDGGKMWKIKWKMYW